MTKDKILEVAKEEFAKYGYAAVSINNLVKKLEINKATVYYHYKDKKALYNEVIKSIIENKNIRTKQIVKTNMEGKDLLKAYINSQVKYIEENPCIIPLVLREIANLGLILEESFVPIFEEDIKYIELILSKLHLKEEYKNISTYAFFSLITGTIFNFYSIQMTNLSLGTKDELKKNSKKSLEYISNFIYNILVSAILKV